ncbi:glycosyltransferase family 2 protein [Marinilabiliaceae bacterium JC017]|nr:glycosyltransferase family 2 protein [Marinilabiliaceae bacterium JC017]
MHSIVFIIPRTPSMYRNQLREQLWQQTIISLENQTYKKWIALVIDEKNLTNGKFQHIKSTARKKGEKIQHALNIIETWKKKPDYLIRLDDDDLISPNALENIQNKNFDVAADTYHTFYDITSGLFCQTQRPWLANTVIHKYEHAIKIMDNGKPLLDQDHSKEWHQYYKNKNIYSFLKQNPLYCRILSNTSVTSALDSNYIKYVQSFGFWKNKIKLTRIFKLQTKTSTNKYWIGFLIRLNYHYCIMKINRKL